MRMLTLLPALALVAACESPPEMPTEQSPIGRPIAAPWPIDCRYPDGTELPAPGRSPVPEEGPWREKLATLWSGLSGPDRAILYATLQQEPDSVMVTTACSQNDVLWTHLALRNFTRPTAGGVSQKMPDSDNIRSFNLTAQRRDDLSRLLAALDAVK